MSTSVSQRNIFQDPSLWLLLLSNIVTIFFAITENWNLSEVMWVYWIQSVTIGIFNFIRILQLEGFSVEGMRVNGQPVAPNRHTKIHTAFFFLCHYGFFHAIYATFLVSGGMPDFIKLKFLIFTAVIFFFNHFFSYFFNRRKDTQQQNIGLLMAYPYLRIIPMHLTIIFGLFLGVALPLFLVLKTIADAVMHAVEHRLVRKGEEQQI